MTLDFNIEILYSEDRDELLCSESGIVQAAFLDEVGEQPTQAGGETHDAIAVLLKHLPCDMGFVSEVVIRLRGQLEQVECALCILCQKDDMVAGQLPIHILHVPLKAQDRLLVCSLHLLIVSEKAVHIAMVSQRPSIFCPLDHIRDLGHTVQQTVIGVTVQGRISNHPRLLILQAQELILGTPQG